MQYSMKTILWISRHEMTTEQMTDLERIMQDNIQLLCCRDTVNQIETILPLLEQADAIAAVLPLGLMSQLVSHANGKLVMQSVSARVPTGIYRTLPDGRTEQEFQFVHQCWQQIIKLEYEVKTL